MVVGEWSTLKVITSKRGENGKFLAENGGVGSDVNAPHSTTTSIVTLFAGSSAQPSYPSSTFDADCSWAHPKKPLLTPYFSQAHFFAFSFTNFSHYIFTSSFATFPLLTFHRLRTERKFGESFHYFLPFSLAFLQFVPHPHWVGMVSFSSTGSVPRQHLCQVI